MKKLTKARFIEEITCILHDIRNLPKDQAMAIAKHLTTQGYLEFAKPEIKTGSKVKVTRGFYVGSPGVVVFVEPGGSKIWVTSQQTDTPVWYTAEELELLE